MSAALSPSTGRRYGLLLVSRIWTVSWATVYRQRQRAGELPQARKRPGPIGPMTDSALVTAIKLLLKISPFHGEGHRKVWARLRFEGIRSSRRRVLRLMREHGLLAHQRVGKPRGSKAHDGTIITERVDEMWGTDMTAVMTGEGQAAVFIAVDHCSAECTGIHASRNANRFEALEPVKQGVRERFGAFADSVRFQSPVLSLRGWADSLRFPEMRRSSWIVRIAERQRRPNCLRSRLKAIDAIAV